jgi:SAM-dependent methyltransferase
MGGSYTSGGQSLGDIFRQIAALRRFYSAETESEVATLLFHMNQVESNVRENYGIELRNLDVLELGPGQLHGQMTYLALHNRVIGIDRDLIIEGLNPMQYITMVARNGPMRAVKTMGRKILGLDRRYRKALCDQLAVRTLPKDVRQSLTTGLPLASQSVDFAYSRAVFQHLPDPAATVGEMLRVLRPGGIFYVSLQPYTSPTASLDPRVFYGGIENELGLWPHLRPDLQHDIRPDARTNKLGLRDWQRLFTSIDPQFRFVIIPTDQRYVAGATALKQKGLLQEYSIEELTAGALEVMWSDDSRVVA